MTNKDNCAAFAFHDRNTARYHDPYPQPIIGVYALNYLRKRAQDPSVAWDAAERAAVEALCAAMATCVAYQCMHETKVNDVPAKQLRVEEWGGGYQWSHRDMLCVAMPRPNGSPTFAPYNMFPRDVFTEQHSSWGWHVAQLDIHCKALKRIAKKEQVGIAVSSIQKINTLQAQMDAGMLVVRQPSAVADLGAGKAWVIYSSRYNSYIDMQWGACTISSARMFSSPLHAEKALKQRNEQGVVVELDLKLAAANMEQLTQSGNGALVEALAAIQKEQMEEALRQMTVEDLQRRLRELGEEPVAAKTAARKRM